VEGDEVPAAVAMSNNKGVAGSRSEVDARPADGIQVSQRRKAWQNTAGAGTRTHAEHKQRGSREAGERRQIAATMPSRDKCLRRRERHAP